MLWVFRRIDGRKLLGFVVAQLLGAVLAGLCLRILFSHWTSAASHLGDAAPAGFRPGRHGHAELAGIIQRRRNGDFLHLRSSPSPSTPRCWTAAARRSAD